MCYRGVITSPLLPRGLWVVEALHRGWREPAFPSLDGDSSIKVLSAHKCRFQINVKSQFPGSVSLGNRGQIRLVPKAGLEREV